MDPLDSVVPARHLFGLPRPLARGACGEYALSQLPRCRHRGCAAPMRERRLDTGGEPGTVYPSP